MPNRPIIVIGAGLAGLTVADELQRRGKVVKVLEARDRVGGRCHTVDGVDMGAHWIHGTEGNPVTALARRLGLPTVFVGGDSTFTGGWDALEVRRAGAVSWADDDKLASILAADEMWDALDALRRERIAGDAPDISIAGAIAELGERMLLPADTSTLDWHVGVLARDDAGLGAEQLSLRSWDEGVDVYGYGDSVLATGYGELAETLANGLDIRLSCPVRRIDWRDPTHVVVTTDDGDEVAESVVVTVPLGVLKGAAIEFTPPLPGPKLLAIERLGVGMLAKVVLTFEDVWWGHDDYVYGVSSAEMDTRPTVIINAAATHREPVLVMLAGGDLGRWVESTDQAELDAWAMEQLVHVFGAEARAPLTTRRTSWSVDPYALGSYSAMAVGASAADILALAEPCGALCFAGEATSEGSWSTAHGAVLSGRREAARLAGDPSIAADRYIAETRRWRRQQQRVMRFHNAVSGHLGEAEMDERLSLLRSVDAFGDVPARDLEAFAAMLTERPIADGERICEVGDLASEVFIIVEGEITAYLIGGRQRATMRRGDMVGELGLLDRERRTAALVVTAPGRLLALDYNRFRRFLLAFPEACLAIVAGSISRLTAAEASTVPES